MEMRKVKWKYDPISYSEKITKTKTINAVMFKISDSLHVLVKKEEVDGKLTTGTKFKPYSCQIMGQDGLDYTTLKRGLNVKGVNEYIDNAMTTADFDIIYGLLVKYHGTKESVTIPNGVKSIYKSAFCNIKTMKNITLPSSITKIGDDAFIGCDSLENVYYNGSIEDWCNIIFEGDTANPMCYANNFFIRNKPGSYIKLTDITIPGCITTINDFAFYGFDQLRKVIIKDGVTNIGASAFTNCHKLTDVSIPDSLLSIDDNAFYNCSLLVNVYYNGTADDWYSIRFGNVNSSPMVNAINFYIEDSSAEYNLLTELAIPDFVNKVLRCRSDICWNLTSLVLHNNVTEIEELAFYVCEKIRDITIHTCDCLCGENIFNPDCPIENIYFSGTPSQWNVIGDQLLQGVKSKPKVHFTNTEKQKGFIMDKFYGVLRLHGYDGECPNVLVIPEDVESIRSEAFADCDTLETLIILNKSKTHLQTRCFYNCSNLTTVLSLGPVEIDNSAFASSTKLVNVIINGDVDNIEHDSFRLCKCLQTVNIAGEIDNICSGAFVGCESLRTINSEHIKRVEHESFTDTSKLDDITSSMIKEVQEGEFPTYCELFDCYGFDEDDDDDDEFYFF